MRHASRQRRIAGDYARAFLPAAVRRRAFGSHRAWGLREMRAIACSQVAPVRLLIGPTNSATQGYYWARAAERLPGVTAASIYFGAANSGPIGRADFPITKTVALNSVAWASRQRQEILRGFTHVLYESQRPLLPAYYGDDLIEEVRDLQDHGISVAMVSHGSDIRLPSRHVQIEPHSPFTKPLDGMTERLEEGAAHRQNLLRRLGVPNFVSTPDLLRYVPDAEWLPTLTDPGLWNRMAPRDFSARPLRVLHIPSRASLKGTQFVHESMERLDEEGVIQYTEAQGVPYAGMPAMVDKADMLIDQLLIGAYGVASVEAMFAGRLVAAHVDGFTREQIARRTGRDLPLIEVDPSTLEDRMREIAADPESYAGLAAEGRQFAEAVHSPELVSEILRSFLVA